MPFSARSPNYSGAGKPGIASLIYRERDLEPLASLLRPEARRVVGGTRAPGAGAAALPGAAGPGRADPRDLRCSRPLHRARPSRAGIAPRRVGVRVTRRSRALGRVLARFECPPGAGRG